MPKHKYADYLENLDSLNKSGHLEVAKWLWTLNQNIDIHKFDDSSFRLSCENSHLEVAKWLCTLCENYHLEYDDNKIITWKILTEQEIEEKNIEEKIK
jgi:hypothetical protein